MWVRAGIAVVLVFVAFFAGGTLLTLGLRIAWPAYRVAEATMHFDQNMQIARLAMGAICTLAAAWMAADIMRSKGFVGIVGSLALLTLFVPVHIGLWDKFPVWYHATFLLSLPLLTWMGASFAKDA